MKPSNFLALNWKDILRGLLMAVLTPSVLIIQQSVSAGSLVFNLHQILMAAVAGGLAYLIKQFFTAAAPKP